MKYKEFLELFPSMKLRNLFFRILAFLFANIFIGCIIMAVISIRNNCKQTSKYPSDRYRRVVKEGLFWDSVEYHER